MPKVVFDISLSLVVHNWAFAGDEEDSKIIPAGVAGTGAVIAGRRSTRMFDAVTNSHRMLEFVSVIHTSTAIHVRARVAR
jgi:hypothetical protein